jgi:signal-transduction protein with cAMP-binding, CBS, and nucleotidyltransferase domain
MITLTAEEIVMDQEREPLSVSPDTTIYNALKLMMEKSEQAVLIKKEGEYGGIWTERDLLHNTLTEGFDPKTANVGDYMSSPLLSAPHTDTVFQLIDKFLGHEIRHLLIEKEGQYIGLLYVRDVIRAGLTERTRAFIELNKIVSLEFYENWKWEKKHK